MCKAFLEVTFYPLYFKLYIQSKQKDMDRKKKKTICSDRPAAGKGNKH